MKKSILILFFVSFCIVSLKSQNNFELWYKISPEIRLNLKNIPVEFRWRPVDNTSLPGINVARTDFMAGLTNKHFKIFSYSKFDFSGRTWTGVRFDFNTSLFDKKLLINIQERYFWGLNENSSQHYYLIQYIRYKTGEVFQTGILSYGKWKTEEPFAEGHWFVGPVTDIKLPYNFNFMTAFAKDVLNEKIYMLFVRLGYRIKIK